MSRAGGRKPSGAAKSVPALDIHAHYFSESYLRVIETQGEAFGVTLDRSDPAGPAIKIGALLGGHLRREFYDLETRLRAMNRAGVQVHVTDVSDGVLGRRRARLAPSARRQRLDVGGPHRAS